MLEARGVRLGYGDRTVLDQIALQVRGGEFWFVVGPNGQGKTTLLRAILGRLRPQAGKIHRYADFTRPDRVGFVPQECGMNPTLPTTVREFVLLGLVGIRAGVEEQAERLAWALDKAGLGGMAAHDYWLLSGGQRQRALVARALVRRPTVFIADEPTSGLDLSVEASLYQSLAALNRSERLTLVMVTHDLGVAARYGTHVALVHHERVQAGPTGEILIPSNLQSAYGISVEVAPEESGAVHIRLGSSEGSV
jgi:zinc transport system ATP-binding protein